MEPIFIVISAGSGLVCLGCIVWYITLKKKDKQNRRIKR